MNQLIRYADPIRVDDPAECQFYHLMNIPGAGEVGGAWDLRHCISEYLGDFDFLGKRVLDVGTASGFLTFEMERMGAEVVSFDMDDGAQWDLVPQKDVRENTEKCQRDAREAHRRLKNAYWFCHSRLGSKARAFYGNIYQMPTELGPFDVAVMAMIISHLRDPFQAMYHASRLCKRHFIVTNPLFTDKRPMAALIPTRENNLSSAWWAFSEVCIEQIFGVLGFKVIRKVTSQPRCMVAGQERVEPCIAVVGERTD